MLRLALLAAAGAIIIYELMNNQNPAPDNLTDPAGRAARARQAIRSVEPRAAQAQILESQARLETDNFKVIHGNSLFNIHVGSGAGDWNKTVAGTDGGSPLRGYDSFEQSVRDMVLLLHRLPSVYGDALAAYEAGDAATYAEAVAHGNGTEGFVGPSNTDKARNYASGISRVYAENFA